MSGPSRNLYTLSHQLNYDEALRRLDYWLNGEAQRSCALGVLVRLLQKNRDNLYFEETQP
jgi:hypothetical protein